MIRDNVLFEHVGSSEEQLSTKDGNAHSSTTSDSQSSPFTNTDTQFCYLVYDGARVVLLTSLPLGKCTRLLESCDFLPEKC